MSNFIAGGLGSVSFAEGVNALLALSEAYGRSFVLLLHFKTEMRREFICAKKEAGRETFKERRKKKSECQHTTEGNNSTLKPRGGC